MIIIKASSSFWPFFPMQLCHEIFLKTSVEKIGPLINIQNHHVTNLLGIVFPFITIFFFVLFWRISDFRHNFLLLKQVKACTLRIIIQPIYYFLDPTVNEVKCFENSVAPALAKSKISIYVKPVENFGKSLH